MLKKWSFLQEILVLLLRAEAHHVLDACTVIPAAVENDHFPCRWETRHIALNVHFGFLAFRRCGQRHHSKDARADPFGNALDGASLTSRITPLKDDDHPRSLVLHPAL